MLGYGAFFILAGMVLIAGAIYFANDLCGNEIEQISESPNRKLKVVIFRRDCGATTGFSRQVSLIPIDKNPGNEAGNIVAFSGLPGLKAVWLDDSNLEIQSTHIAPKHAPSEINGVQVRIVAK